MTVWPSEGSLEPIGVLAALLVLLALSYLHRHNVSLKLPPGPASGYLGKGRFDMPEEPYKRFTELAAVYGTHNTRISFRHCNRTESVIQDRCSLSASVVRQ